MNKISKEQQTKEKEVITKDIPILEAEILNLGITLEEMLLLKESTPYSTQNSFQNVFTQQKIKTEALKRKNNFGKKVSLKDEDSIDEDSKDILDRIAKLPGKLINAYSSGFKDGGFGGYTTAAFHQEAFCNGLYNTPKLNYFDTLSSLNLHTSKEGIDEEYNASRSVAKEESENISPAQAQKTFMEINYAAAAGAYTSVSFKERQKLDMWIKFNRALFHGLLEPNSITRDVDYSRTG